MNDKYLATATLTHIIEVAGRSDNGDVLKVGLRASAGLSAGPMGNEDLYALVSDRIACTLKKIVKQHPLFSPSTDLTNAFVIKLDLRSATLRVETEPAVYTDYVVKLV